MLPPDGRRDRPRGVFFSEAEDKPDDIIPDLHEAPLAALESLPPR